MNRWFVVILVVFVAAIAGAAHWYLSAGIPVQTASVERGEIREYVDERGKTRLAHTYDVTMPFAGRIEKIDLSEGDRVEQGQVVAQVVSSDLANEVAEAQAAVDRLQAAVDENSDHSVEKRTREQALEFIKSMIHTVAAAEARITAGEKRVKYAESFFGRTSELYQKKAKSVEEFELAELRLVESQVEHQQDQLVWRSMQSILAATQLLPKIIDEYVTHKSLTGAVLEKQKAEAQAHLQQILQRRERGTMHSPVTGVVLEKTMDDEQFVPAGAVLLKVGRLSDLEVEADILSQDATRIQKGAAASIYALATGSGTGRRVDGMVDRVYPQAFTKISSLGVEQQRVKVVVRFSDEAIEELQQLGVRADYRVRVRIFTARRTGSLLVPRSALFRGSDGGWRVFAVRRGCARLQDVTVGLMNDEHVEVIGGLEENESVILAPENEIEDGSRVKAALIATSRNTSNPGNVGQVCNLPMRLKSVIHGRLQTCPTLAKSRSRP